VQPEKFAQHATHAVAPYRPPDLPAHRETDAEAFRPRLRVLLAVEEKQHEMAGEDLATLLVANAEAFAYKQAAAFGPV
jgi:hypothetical protein